MLRRALPALFLPLVLAACRGKDPDPAGGAKRAVSATRFDRVESADVPERRHRPAASGTRAPVIWLGLDGLDWELLDRLAAEGKMPHWAGLVREGSTARLRADAPLLSPLLWSSAATGVAPDVHRVLDFQEVDPDTGRKVPITGRSRAVAAVWNLASASGRSVGVVGWWASHPAEEVSGFFVSDHASPILFERPSFAGVVYPATLEAAVSETATREARVESAELDAWIGPAPVPTDARRGELARILGATRVNHRLARELYDRQLPDLLALYLEGTDEIGHLFGTYAAPKLACVSEADFARYGPAVDRYYGMVDALLGQWMRRAREDGATLIVHSDHGFKWGADRPCGFASGDWSTAAFWHRPAGVFAAWGARVRPGAERGEATLLDVAPTVLALLGLPADPRMPGAPIRAAFPNLAGPPARPWLTETAVRRLAAAPVSPEAASDYARKLIALGYLSGADTQPVAAPGGVSPGLTEGAWNNLGVFLRDTRHEPRRAREAFERALALRPDYPAALFNVAVLERAAGRDAAAVDLLLRSVRALNSDPAPAVTAWAREYERTGKTKAARSLLEAAAREHPGSEEIGRSLAVLHQRSGDCGKALEVLSPFGGTTRRPRTLNALALVQTCLGNRVEVVRLLARSLALDPNQPEVARALAAARGEPPTS